MELIRHFFLRKINKTFDEFLISFRSNLRSRKLACPFTNLKANHIFPETYKLIKHTILNKGKPQPSNIVIELCVVGSL